MKRWQRMMIGGVVGFTISTVILNFDHIVQFFTR